MRGASFNDVVIVSALRTPICKARRGSFKDTLPDDLLTCVFKAVLKETGIAPSMIQDICIGNVLQPSAGASMGRVAQFFSGIPETVPLYTTCRMCSSGLQAVINIAQSIQTGMIDLGLAAGVESLTINPLSIAPPGFVVNPKVGENKLAMDSLLPMGITSENVAERYGITRVQQDKMAVESHAKAARAQKNGYFKDEIVPVKTKITDKDGKERSITVTADDGVRPGTNMETLSRLKPAFKPGGSTTAGNASQVSDGAAAVIVTRRATADALGLPVLGALKSYAVVGVPPDVMGIGPAFAIPIALQRAGLGISDIDIFELNEAFASQATYCVEKLGIPYEKLNPKGGAIALGHPVGCTGARQVATLLHELKRRGKRAYGVVSMCMGTGMGAAAVFEYPGQIGADDRPMSRL
ncbi:hypothetical protein NP493_742g00002 [Ridgeia piscesae]|uniref:Uncharacterized protein n=1 Tax=Ridgeia piscesae TaxID=27915 RepID=A0AAD9KPF0_RIDPI|nr:hypothetical protein NP493_742g00002 [Ridgeia piscesae]